MSSKTKQLHIIKILTRYRRVIWITLSDKQVSLTLKALIVGMIVYVASPIDILPDFIPLIGQIDDITIVIMILEYVRKSLPDHIQDEVEGKVIKGK